MARAIEAGVGTEVSVSVGGRLDPRYNRPVAITGRVHILSDGRFVGSDQKSRGTEGRMGRAAVIEVGAISVLVTERPAFTVDPAFFRSVGLEPREAKIVVVKSPLQFRDGYGGFAKDLWVVDTPVVEQREPELHRPASGPLRPIPPGSRHPTAPSPAAAA